jgi:hypothetical protein
LALGGLHYGKRANLQGYQDLYVFPSERNAYLRRCLEEDQRVVAELEAEALRGIRVIEEQRKEQSRQWESQGLCKYCGGSFTGLIGKKCASCGVKKNAPGPGVETVPFEPAVFSL